MNVFTRKTLKVSLVVFIIGALITIIALAIGGRFEHLPYKHNLTNVDQSYTDVKSLNINLDASQVQVKNGNEFKIEANDVSNDTFKSYVKDGVWFIEDNEKCNFISFNNSNITIYLPENFNSENLKINIGAGELIASKLSASNTDIVVGAGNLKINDLTTNELNIDCGVGNVEINGIVNNKGYAKCGIGNVKLDLKGNEKDYNYNLNVGIGDVELNNQNFSGIGNKVIDNSSKDKTFKIDCGIGKVSLGIK